MSREREPVSPRGRRLTTTHWGTYETVVEDGRLTELRGVEGDAEPSPIGFGMPQTLHDAVRIAQPMAREGWRRARGGGDPGCRGSDAFVPISWDEALDLVAAELDRVRSAYGNEAIFGGSYGWGSAGAFHHAPSQLHRFLGTIGGYTASVGTYSTGAMEVIVPHVLGDLSTLSASMPTWDEIARHTELVVALGGLPLKNTQVDWGGTTWHDGAGAQERCRQAGVKFVNVGPLRSDIDATVNARWLPIRPCSDTALLLALIHCLVVSGRHDLAFLEDCCVGWGALERYLLGRDDGQPKSAAWAASLCGVDVAAITALAEQMATHRTLLTASWSVQRADHGEQPYWAAIALAAASGSAGRPGGGFGAGYASVHQTGRRGSRAAVRGVPAGLNRVRARIPVSRLTEMLECPGARFDFNGVEFTYPDIRLVYWAGGNPFHHQQDLNRLRAAWQRPETVIVHEPWWNPMARHADVVLPMATSLEREDIGGDHVLVAMKRAVEPPWDLPTDHQIFAWLSERLGTVARFTDGLDPTGWVRRLYGEAAARASSEGTALPDFDAFWDIGTVELPAAKAKAKPLERLRQDPQRWPIPTPSGRIELFSELIAAFDYPDCPPHPTWIPPAEWLGSDRVLRYPLHLISNQPSTRLHSQYDNGGYSRSNKRAGREPITINGRDGAARGIEDGDVVRVFNDRGACLAGAVLSDRIRPGVVQLSTGAWLDLGPDGRGGFIDRHGNPNVLTLDKGTSRLAQASSAQTALVEVERFDGEPPPVEAFDPPRLAEGPEVGEQKIG